MHHGLNEYKKYLHKKAKFLLPIDIEELLSTRGIIDNYFNQTIMFDRKSIEEENIFKLLNLISKYKKGNLCKMSNKFIFELQFKP
jgi:hypothetical protein